MYKVGLFKKLIFFSENGISKIPTQRYNKTDNYEKG